MVDGPVVDYLQFWHPVRNAATDENYLPWGQVRASSSEDKQVRVRNASATYTAVDIAVSIAEIGLLEPVQPVAPQHFLSLDGRRFTATVGIGTLAPGAVSGIITVRRVTAPDADTGEGEFQLTAHPDQWT